MALKLGSHVLDREAIGMAI
jgi:hypothetical protein